MPVRNRAKLLTGAAILTVLAATATQLAAAPNWRAPVRWLSRALASRPDDHAPRPETARVERRDLSTVIKATGVVRPALGAEVRVAFRNPGIIRRLHVHIGDHVRKGQLLAELQTRELAAQRDRAAAALKSAELARDYSATESAHAQQLVQAQALPQRELDRAEQTAALARAAVHEAAATLAAQRANLDDSLLYAPINGTVASLARQEGESAAASFAGSAGPDSTLLTLIDLKQLEVWAYVDETDIGRIELGQQARFSVDAYPGRDFEARVASIHPKAEIRDNVVNYVVVLGISRQAQRPEVLRPEMTATVQIVEQAARDALTLPKRALRREHGRPFVFVVTRQGLQRRPVVTGRRDDSSWEITQGLAAEDVVALGDVPEPSK